jgi:hypothetical protein
MEKNKVVVSVEIESDQQEWLAQMATEYDLRDTSKALRVVLDHAMMDLDSDAVFLSVRCRRCGD